MGESWEAVDGSIRPSLSILSTSSLTISLSDSGTEYDYLSVLFTLAQLRLIFTPHAFRLMPDRFGPMI